MRPQISPRGGGLSIRARSGTCGPVGLLRQERFEGTVDCFLRLAEAAKHYPEVRDRWVEFLGERPDAAIDRVEETTRPA